MYNKKIIGLGMCFGLFMIVGSTFAAQDIMELMFQPAKEHEKIVDLGADKNAVGNEVFRESTQFGIAENLGKDCSLNGKVITFKELTSQKNAVGYKGAESEYCEKVLGGDMDVPALTKQEKAPLIVRITKFLLRMTVVLAITMVLYNGILWIVESAKGGDVKDAKDNLIYIIGGILVALSSVALINLVSSITLSSLSF